MSEALSSVRKDVSQSKEKYLSFVCAVHGFVCAKKTEQLFLDLFSVSKIRSTGQ